ncbi:MAG TPA: response regulator [Geothermobacteraceae bacterium]|nr:response regulator [Geothermobacteraceae bacterium]
MFTKKVLSMYSKTILIVDDWQLFQEMIEDIFRREQVTILKAKSGPDALEVIRKERPDLVFMDLFMTGGNGDDACREIKSDPDLQATPIIMVTSSDNPDDAARCRQTGCDALIRKPFTREELRDVSRKFIEFPEWSGKRARITTRVRYGLPPEELGEGTLTDISVGGIYLVTENLLPIGSKFQLEFRPAQHLDFIRCTGRVAWNGRKSGRQQEGAFPGMGIEFVDIKKLDLLTIQALVANG